MREPRWPSRAEIRFTEIGGVIAATISTLSREILATFERDSPVEVTKQANRLGSLHGCLIMPVDPNPSRMKEHYERAAALRAEIEAWDGTPGSNRKS